jgi:hypothetical protein
VGIAPHDEGEIKVVLFQIYQSVESQRVLMFAFDRPQHPVWMKEFGDNPLELRAILEQVAFINWDIPESDTSPNAILVQWQQCLLSERQNGDWNMTFSNRGHHRERDWIEPMARVFTD